MSLKRGYLAIDNDTSATSGGDDVDTEHDCAKRLKIETAEDGSDDKEDWRAEHEAQKAIWKTRHGFYPKEDEEEDRHQLKRVTACGCKVCEDAIQARLNKNAKSAMVCPKAEKGKPKTVACFCEEEHDDEEMVYCWQCSRWQHYGCYYSGESHKELLDEDFEHWCQECKPWPSSEERRWEEEGSEEDEY